MKKLPHEINNHGTLTNIYFKTDHLIVNNTDKNGTNLR